MICVETTLHREMERRNSITSIIREEEEDDEDREKEGQREI